MRIIIADDHAIVREGLKQIILKIDINIKIDETDNGDEVLEMIKKQSYDVAILDITMKGLSGLEVLKRLKIENPSLPVLILSIHPVDQYAIRVIKAGAAGYLVKDSAPKELADAIKKVSSGGKYITSLLAEKMAVELGHEYEKDPHELLSDREFQVFLQIANGKTTIGIADELYISPKTVGTYRHRILQKFNKKSNADLTRYALERKLI